MQCKRKAWPSVLESMPMKLAPIMHPRVSIWSGLVKWSHPQPSCAGMSKENGAIRHGLERAPSLRDAPGCCRRRIKHGFGVEMLAARYLRIWPHAGLFSSQICRSLRQSLHLRTLPDSLCEIAKALPWLRQVNIQEPHPLKDTRTCTPLINTRTHLPKQA